MQLTRQYDGQTIFIVCGRAFVLADLKRSILAACGGYAVGIWCTWLSDDIQDTIEAIELVAMLHEKDG